MLKSKLKRQNYVSSIFDTSSKKVVAQDIHQFETRFKTSSKLNG
jgi:hypothetical protein